MYSLTTDIFISGIAAPFYLKTLLDIVNFKTKKKDEGSILFLGPRRTIKINKRLSDWPA